MDQRTVQQPWRERFVSAVWATHNNSQPIRTTLKRCWQKLDQNGLGLNVGAGGRSLHPRLINLDLVSGNGVHVSAAAEQLPFTDAVFDLVVTQETLEHVRDPFRAMQEISRVLKPGGWVYCQVPFVIGYHPGPTDFWRFTREGIRAMVEQAGLKCEELSVAVGPGTGFYRVVVEFWATLVARFAAPLYLPAKGILALLFFPLKWLDPLLRGSAQADRIAGGYFVVASR